MPFRSQAQRKYLFMKEPQLAHKWAKETPNMKSLPSKISTELTNRRMKKHKKAK